MRLRRVVISGFKTFARRTELELDPGITAVVGPNGSGKSNLVDAVRWALGETNARELRGARMDEVIHAGGPGRPQLGMAQVDVVLDNEEGRIALEGAEVQISRRVTRHGDSEYRINGSRCRLRDLERALSATGLTQSGYAVVAQNDVDGIIEATPGQRRTLVEEAAGVRGLRAAREDALARVGAVETGLLRLRDLLSEAEPRLADLAVQAEAALEQRQLAARLAELRGSLAREEWRAARGGLRKARQRLEAARSRGAAAAEAEGALARHLEAGRGRLATARRRRDEVARRLEDARLTAERADGDRRRFEDRVTAASLQRATVVVEEHAARADALRQGTLVEELAGAGGEASALLDCLAAEGVALAGAHAEAARHLDAAEEAAAAATATAAAAERQAAAASARARDHRARTDLLSESATGLEAAGAAAEMRLVELAEHEVRATARGRAAALDLTAATAAVEGAESALDAARAHLAKEEREQATAVASVREMDARAAALRGQLEGALGEGNIIARAGTGALEAGRLVERFELRDDADAAAVEAALEAHLGAWVVNDVEAALAVMDADGVREEALEAGLAVPPAAPQPPPGVRAAMGAVTPHPRAAGALAHCLRGVWLAPDLDMARDAVAVADGLAVLPDGTVITRAGVRGGGRPGATIALAAAERDTAAALATLVAAAAGLDARVQAAASAADERAGAVNAIRVVADEARAATAAAGAAAASAAAALVAEQQRAAHVTAELAQRRSAVAAARAEALEAEAGAAALVAEAVASSAAAAALAVGRAAAAARLSDTAATLRAHELLVARAEPEARDVHRRLAAARSAQEYAEERARVCELRRCAAEEAALASLVRAVDRRARVALALAAVREAHDDGADAAAPVGAMEAALAALEGDRTEVAVAAARAADELQAATQEADALAARVEELAEVLRDDELDEGPEPDAAAAERAEREIVRLERRISTLGAVNGLAPGQHEVLSTRVERLRGDNDDLAGACGDIRALADHLATEIDGRFEAVFGAVAYHFRLLYEELFPGGRATLRLEPPVDETDAPEDSAMPRHRPAPPGVEILAQPAGKRLQALSLLSGGERALTALAVILALQQVNPSPFYVFDEVDAPLDDANIARFTHLLRRLAESQQFLVVTHNHATMAAADALYGVTMGDDGISRLLSVRFVKGEPVPRTRQAAETAAAS